MSIIRLKELLKELNIDTIDQFASMNESTKGVDDLFKLKDGKYVPISKIDEVKYLLSFMNLSEDLNTLKSLIKDITDTKPED